MVFHLRDFENFFVIKRCKIGLESHIFKSINFHFLNFKKKILMSKNLVYSLKYVELEFKLFWCKDLRNLWTFFESKTYLKTYSWFKKFRRFFHDQALMLIKVSQSCRPNYQFYFFCLRTFRNFFRKFLTFEVVPLVVF